MTTIDKNTPSCSPSSWVRTSALTTTKTARQPFSRTRSRSFSRTLAKTLRSDLSFPQNGGRSTVEADCGSCTKHLHPESKVPFNYCLANDLCSIGEPNRDLCNLREARDKLGSAIFVGNIPCNVSKHILVQFLQRKMYRAKHCVLDHKTFLRCRMNKRFAFIECASIEDANKALQLDCTSLLGSKLRITSPSRYIRNTNKQILLDLLAEPSNVWIQKSVHAEAVEDFSIPSKSVECTRVLEIKNALSVDDLEYDEDYREAMDEIKDECIQYGSLKKICMPRTGIHATKIFVEYGCISEAERALNGLRNKTFDGNAITVEFVGKDYDHLFDQS